MSVIIRFDPCQGRTLIPSISAHPPPLFHYHGPSIRSRRSEPHDSPRSRPPHQRIDLATAEASIERRPAPMQVFAPRFLSRARMMVWTGMPVVPGRVAPAGCQGPELPPPAPGSPLPSPPLHLLKARMMTGTAACTAARSLHWVGPRAGRESTGNWPGYG